MMTVSAATKLMPRPPARVHSKNTKLEEGKTERDECEVKGAVG